KAQILGALAADIRALELREGASYPLYEEWIAAGLNNARLASVSTYFDCLPGFTRLLGESGNDLTRFYAAARELARQPRAVRRARVSGSGTIRQGRRATWAVRRTISASVMTCGPHSS